jgi:hypothetical protein
LAAERSDDAPAPDSRGVGALCADESEGSAATSKTASTDANEERLMTYLGKRETFSVGTARKLTDGHGIREELGVPDERA